MAQLFSLPPIWQKPGIDAQLDYSNPHTADMVLCALLAEGAGGVGSPLTTGQVFKDLARGQKGVLQTTAAGTGWIAGRTGPAFNLGSSAEIRFTNGTNWPTNDTDPFTMIALVNPTSVGADGACIINIGEAIDSNSQISMGLVTATNALCVVGQGNGYNTGSPITSGIALSLGKWAIVGCAQQSITRRLFGVYDFAKYTTATSATATVNGAIGRANPWDIGRCFVNSSMETAADWVGGIEFVFVWKRAMSADTLASVITNPYQLFLPSSNRRWFVPPPVSTVAVAALLPYVNVGQAVNRASTY